MDLQRSYTFIVFIVMLIHEVVFSECDLNTKTHNHLIKSYVDGFQRKERQAPIDPSRMYLPPRVDSVASAGFGDQNVNAANNFGDNAADGYGEVALVQDTAGGQPAADDGGGIGSYGVPTKIADYGPPQGVPESGGGGGDGAPSGQNSAGAAAPDRNNFGRYAQNKNTGDELLSTAQNRGPTGNGNNYNHDDRSGGLQGAGGSATGSAGQSAVAGARQYGGARNSYGQRGDGGDAGPKRDRAFTASGYGNAVPNSSDRKPTATGGYGKNGGGSNADVNDLQTGQSAAATPQTDDGGGNEWSAAGYDDRGETASSYVAGYGLTSSGGVGLDQGTSPSNGGFNSARGSDNYGRIPSDGSNDAYDGQSGGFDQQSFDAYGQPAGLAQSVGNGGDSGQGQSSVPANGGYDRHTPSHGPSAGFDQSQRGASQVINNYGPTESQLSPSSRNGYDHRSPTNGPNGYGLAGSQIFPSTGDGYSQNSPTYGGYTRDSSNPTQTSERNNYAQIDTPGNGLPTRSSVQGSTSSSSGLGQPCRSSCSSTSTRPQADSRNESQNKKKYSTIVPKAQYQNSNLPSNDNFEKQGNEIQNANNNGDFGQPGSNAFSNFAPGNLPNPPNNLNNDQGEFGQPGPNAFSNFAPSTQLNPPIDNGDFGQPSSNAFSNFAPGNQPNPPINYNKNNCGTDNHGNNGNTQYESVFSASNTGY